MIDEQLSYINTMILKKKQSIDSSKHRINQLTDITKDFEKKFKTYVYYNIECKDWKKNMDKYMNEIRQLNREIPIDKKELKIYENERKKRRKDPKYNIDIDLLEKKHDVYNRLL